MPKIWFILKIDLTWLASHATLHTAPSNQQEGAELKLALANPKGTGGREIREQLQRWQAGKSLQINLTWVTAGRVCTAALSVLFKRRFSGPREIKKGRNKIRTSKLRHLFFPPNTLKCLLWWIMTSASKCICCNSTSVAGFLNDSSDGLVSVGFALEAR